MTGRKFLVLFTLCALSQLRCDAAEPPFPIGSKLSRTLQTVTGVNLIGGAVADVVATGIAKKKLGGHVKVKVRIYSVTDLFAGKVKSVSVKADGCTFKHVPLGSVRLVSDNPIWFNWHKRNGVAPGLSGPIGLTVSGTLRQDDVCKALATEALANSLRGLKLDLPGLGEQQLQVLSPKVSMADKRITIEALLITKGAPAETGVNLTISAVPVLQGSKIMLTETKVSCADILDSANFSKFAEDLFNPIVDFGKFDRKDHAFRLSSFSVEQDKVSGEGKLLLVPRPALEVSATNVSKSSQNGSVSAPPVVNGATDRSAATSTPAVIVVPSEAPPVVVTP